MNSIVIYLSTIIYFVVIGNAFANIVDTIIVIPYLHLITATIAVGFAGIFWRILMQTIIKSMSAVIAIAIVTIRSLLA
jgi:hypothetical protein